MKNSFLLLQLAVMMFGFSGVISRVVGCSPVTLTGGRVIFSSVILLLILLIRKETLRAKKISDSVITILAGLLLTIHWVTFFQSIKIASVAIGTITYSTFPLFLLFLEPVLYHEKMSGKNMILSLGLITGVLITIPEFSFSNGTTEGIMWGMICSITYALMTLCNRYLAGKYSGTWVSFREQIIVAVVLLTVLLFRKEPVSKMDILGIAAIGIVCTALAFSMFVSAQKGVSAQTAGIVAGMETVYGIVFAMLFLGEMPAVREIIGGIIILITAALVDKEDRRK